MKLHRLTLTNYRGISHRDIEFPDHGVVIVSGANEIGKSSMLEALDLLLEAKDRSTKKEVKQVKPTHADVGAEVTAEISTGPYRFVYRKRFHKRAETELTITAPRREQLTGDEAHDRVRAMLAETVDLDLWQAQRVLQSAATSAVDLSGSNALSRALDVVAGEVDDAAGAGEVDTLLIDRIDDEYRRYFTATGRPTGEWAAATARLRAADEQVARCAAAVAEVDEAVRRHAALTAELAGLADETAAATAQLAAAREAAGKVAALRGELDRATVLADAATAAHTTSQARLVERRRARADIDDRAAAITRMQDESDAAAEELATATEVHAAAEGAAERARAALEAGQARVDAARAAVQRMSDREEADRLTARIGAIEARTRELEAVAGELAGITLTAALMQSIADAAAAVDRAGAAVERAATHLELRAVADLEIRVGAETVALRAGETFSAAVAGRTDLDIAGLLALTVAPGGSAGATAAALAAAEADLAAALERAGVADVAAARALDERRRELLAAQDRLRGVLEALTGDDDIADLRARLATLRSAAGSAADPDDAGGPADAAALRAELDAATAAHQQAVRDCETHRKVAEEAARRLADREVKAGGATTRLQAAQAELAAAEARLAAHRAAASDDELAVKAQTDADTVTTAKALVDTLAAELATHQPDTVAAALAAAERAATDVTARRDHAADALREVAAQLKVYGTQGRQGDLDAAQTEREHAEAEFGRVQRRARAAHLLKTVMGRHRDAMRQRYVDPFRGEVERLGRIVFGDTFEVDVDSGLRVEHRTLAGRTVPYESLSGGAKEQLGIIARLAGAALVGTDDNVPVVIDDALGFTDADRLTKMAEVFDTVGAQSQVIILTCSPQRYAGIRSAEHIELIA
ncbi:AAA family ATPase [Mycolicibacterium sp.]|uniref:AAA family ATPase n=1 Tax=Mycolicibacterium sp. TaxID=2320850 RepID=UPI003D0F5AEC